ncbi:class I SAM-dependent methyltransferase, partial [Candidatus Kaiserbacteria bacterium]|nr:class I SAM-dependent methyltransferase [Candidatus Kaiserbacteria bacterium]
FPNLEYVGVEPIPASFAAAENNLTGIKNVKIHFQLGYDSVPNESEETFDLVFSLSVLEHVKQLEKFIALGAKYVKKGGMMVHRYDLGHALYPHSLKERVHAFVGNTCPSILPERQFVRYVPEEEVRAIYVSLGIQPTHATYHQMPNHKHLEKKLDSDSTAMEELFAWEIAHQAEFKKIPLPDRELLFPAVSVWGEK